MSTEDQAAKCIQARVRGFQWRHKQQRGIRAVTKLQALQRGRFTRREFAELRDFSREQENFQQATRRRQNRIWRNEQELYFLQHTNAADLERVRAFQQQHSARLIQRTWRTTTQPTAESKGNKTEIIDPSDRIYSFDPFGLVAAPPWDRDKECNETSQRLLSPLLNNEPLRSHASVQKIPAAIAGDEAFASRRKTIQERIKRKAAQEKAKTESPSKPRATVGHGLTESSKPMVNRRRELYEQVVAMKRTAAQRVLQYERGTRASRPDKELRTAQVVASCENRIKHLQAEKPEQMIPPEDNQQVHTAAQLMEKWDPARRARAWNHHCRAVCSVLEKRHWWQTQLAGHERDIRQVVVAKSPWEDENKIWVWPRSERCSQKDSGFAKESINPPGMSSSAPVWPSMEIHRFLVGDKSVNEPQGQSLSPVGDAEASEWWTAHCTQSHLTTNGALLIETPYRAEFSNNVTNEGDVFPVCTSEVVANRELYNLQQQAKHAAYKKCLERDVEQRIKDLTTQVERRVHEMEVQVEANTQLALEIVRRKEEQRVRITREQQAAMTIQRHVRGMQGRRCAREQRAEFFVMVRGRAIRRGRCEECGDQRAVLECQQCEESVHFCPICWVHVHSTRRRKAHVAIPMMTVVAPTPVRDVESAMSPSVTVATPDSSKMTFESVDENLGPRLRPLASPRKQNSMQSADPAAIKTRTTDVDTHLSAMSSKRDDVRSAMPLKSTDFRDKSTSELAEACALARQVRAELDPVSVSPESISVPEPEEGSSDLDLLIDAATASTPDSVVNSDATAESVELRAPPIAEPHHNAGSDGTVQDSSSAENAEVLVSSAEENGEAINPSRCTAAEAARTEDVASASSDPPIPAQKYEEVRTTEQNDGEATAGEAATASEGVSPSELAEEVS